MQPDQVAKWLGEPRFRAYLAKTDGQHERAVALYRWNGEVSAAFFEVIHHLEVLMRNAIDRRFPEPDTGAPLSILVPDVWLCNTDVLTEESLEKVNEAITRLQRNGKRPTRDRVIASLSFGFWQALFSSVYEELWRENLSKAFPNGTGRRREVANLSGPVLQFRNRIAHHEAIFSSNLNRQHSRILRLAGLIDEEAERYIASFSRVEQLLSERPEL